MNRFLFLVLALAGTAGCFVVHLPEEKSHKDKEENSDENAASSCTESNLPAAVEAMLSGRCQGCHSEGGKSPMPLMSYDELMAPAPSDDSRTVAALILDRIQSSDDPMPPSKDGVTVPQEEIDAFQAWIDAGTPKEETNACASDDDAPAEITSVCTSDTTWNPKGGNVTLQDEDDDDDRFGPRMNPGKACIDCHSNKTKDKEPILQIGGTVYPTVREPDLCYGAGNAGAKVVVIDANGTEWPMDVTDTGNFSWGTDQDEIPFPITAKVVLEDGSERVMDTPQDSGDCNSCHTETGDNGAPGRIFLP